MESTAVFLRALITCYTGLALAQGKVLGTKPQGVFAPAIRPSLPSQHNPSYARIFTSTALPTSILQRLWELDVGGKFWPLLRCACDCPEQVAEVGCSALAAPSLGPGEQCRVTSVCTYCLLPSTAVTPGLGLGFLTMAGSVRTRQLHKGIAGLNAQEGCGLLVYCS